jgi:lysophospholipase L1-like esterase
VLSSTATQETDEFPIILLTPPPFDAVAWGKFRNLEVYEGRTNQVARTYGEIASEVAKANQCSVINVWEVLEGRTSPEVYGRYLSDGLHLNELGNRKVHRSLMKLLREDYPHLVPLELGGTSQSIPLEGRLWDELC